MRNRPFWNLHRILTLNGHDCVLSHTTKIPSFSTIRLADLVLPFVGAHSDDVYPNGTYCCSIAPRGHKRCLCRLTLCSGLWYVMWRSLEQLNFFGTRINGNSIRNFGCLRNGLEWETESAPTRRHRATIHINTSSRRVHDFRHVDWADDTHTNTHTQCMIVLLCELIRRDYSNERGVMKR